MRDWWLRTVLVLQSPRAVFVALRDDTPESAADRSEPVLLVVLVAGISYVLSTRTTAHLMDDNEHDGLDTAIWAFLAGSLFGGAAYWAFGGILHRVLVSLGSQGSYRRTRHTLAFAAVPFALSLILWPVKLALYGSALFHQGGADAGSGGQAFDVLGLGLAAWSVALLVVGVRSAQGWTWARALGAVAGACLIPAALIVAANVS